MKKCTSCGIEIDDNAKFCKFCGASQSETVAENVAEKTVKNVYDNPYEKPAEPVNDSIYSYSSTPTSSVFSYDEPVVDTEETVVGSVNRVGKSIASYIFVLITSLLSIGMMFTSLAIYAERAIEDKITIKYLFKNVDRIIDRLKRYFSYNPLEYIDSIVFYCFLLAILVIVVVIAIYALVSIIIAIVKMCNSREDEKFAVRQLKGLGKLYLALGFLVSVSFCDYKPGTALFVAPAVMLFCVVITMLMFANNKNKKNVAFSVISAIMSYVLAFFVVMPVITDGKVGATMGLFVRGIFEKDVKSILILVFLFLVYLTNEFGFDESIKCFRKDKSVSTAMIVSGTFNTIFGIAALVTIELLEADQLRVGAAVIVYIAVGVLGLGLGILGKCIKDKAE